MEILSTLRDQNRMIDEVENSNTPAIAANQRIVFTIEFVSKSNQIQS